jgi:hypothetical protein
MLGLDAGDVATMGTVQINNHDPGRAGCGNRPPATILIPGGPVGSMGWSHVADAKTPTMIARKRGLPLRTFTVVSGL